MDQPLYSARAGRARTLNQYDFTKLLWRSVFAPVHKQALLAEALVGPMKDLDSYLLDRLNTSQITGHELLSEDGPDFFMAPDEDVVIDLLELLHAECISAPASINLDDAGEEWVEGPFDRAEGQRIFRDLLNPILARHTPPLEMRPNGHIIETPPDSIQPLLDESMPRAVQPELREPVETAIERFYRRGAIDSERREAVRNLGDVLEHQRSAVKVELLSKDENALFEIANGFSIRHHNRDQRTAYDKGIWLEWIFHVYLATAKALIRVQERDQAPH